MYTSRRGISARALALWLAIQLLALLLAAIRTPYSNHFPQPPEQMALEEMLIVQITAAALLFPLLMGNAATGTAAVIVSWPLTLLAGFLSAQVNALKIVCPAALVSLWMGGLGIWLYILPTQRTRFFGVAVATALALGGPLLWYLRAAFGGGPAQVVWSGHGFWSGDGWWGPLMAALGLCDGSPGNKTSWKFLAAFLLLTAVCVALAGLRRRRESLQSEKKIAKT